MPPDASSFDASSVVLNAKKPPGIKLPLPPYANPRASSGCFRFRFPLFARCRAKQRKKRHPSHMQCKTMMLVPFRPAVPLAERVRSRGAMSPLIHAIATATSKHDSVAGRPPPNVHSDQHRAEENKC